MFYDVLIVIYLVVAVLLIGCVLIQQGKGADMGASFGSGGANTVFGASGGGNFLTRSTAVLATLFFVISLILGGLSNTKTNAEDQWQQLDVPSDVQVKPEQLEVPVVEQASSEIPSVEESTVEVPVTDEPSEEIPD